MVRISIPAPTKSLNGPSLTEFLAYFLKLGALGFGGPIALAGHMQKELVEERKWVSSQDYVEGLAFSQLSPGPIRHKCVKHAGRRNGRIPLLHRSDTFAGMCGVG